MKYRQIDETKVWGCWQDLNVSIYGNVDWNSENNILLYLVNSFIPIHSLNRF